MNKLDSIKIKNILILIKIVKYNERNVKRMIRTKKNSLKWFTTYEMGLVCNIG